MMKMPCVGVASYYCWGISAVLRGVKWHPFNRSAIAKQLNGSSQSTERL
ncbi:MAG: hypothetical protein IJ069_06605 [Prevotella sp.]|nr:hypothetical protein [Prevotella sp.]MBQ8713610.1 hypothetical protein [Prevotella sp.]